MERRDPHQSSAVTEQWCLSYVPAQTRVSCKKLRNLLRMADPTILRGRQLLFSFLCATCYRAVHASIVAKNYHVLRTCLGSWPAVLLVNLKRSQMGPQYDICRDLSRTGPLFSTVFCQMGKVPYSHLRSPVRSDTAQSRVWEPCAHRARAPVGILGAPRCSRRPPKAHSGSRLGFIQELRGAFLRRFVAARQNDYASHAGALSYGAAVAPRCTSRIENVVVKRTFYIALSRLPGERDLVAQGSGRTGLILPSDCSLTPPCPSRQSRPPHLAPPAQVGHLKKYTRRPP